MNRTLKRLALLGLGIAIIGGSGFAAYKYSDNIRNLFSAGYSDSYTLEEVNEKILTFQKKSVEKIEEAYNQVSANSRSQRITGNMDLNLKAQSSLGGGSGSLDLKNIDIQYTPSTLDIVLQGLAVEGTSKIFGEELSGNLKLGEGHLITNASGSYIRAKELAVDTANLGQEILPEEIIMTLNKLGGTDKYIDLSQNFIYDILKSQMSSQSGNAEEMQQFILDFIKNEAIFEAYKQEGTKYHLAPSKAVCTLVKNERNNVEDLKKKFYNNETALENIYLFTPSYEEFKKTFIECSEGEQITLIEALRENEMIKLTNLYIELNTTKLHYVVDIVGASLKKGEGATEIETGLEGTLSLTQSESSKMYMRIKNDAITGSGILIEQTGEAINGYLDIDMPEYNFDSNLIIGGTNDKVTVSGDYSYAAPQDIGDRDLQQLQGGETSGTIQGDFSPENYNLKITNIFSQGESGANGELTMDINGGKTGDVNKGKLILSGKVQMGANASPMTGNLTTTWNTQTNKSMAKGDISYTLEVPNIASGEYKINYDFAISDILTSDFQTPENIIPQKNLNSLIMVNKKKVEKDQEKKMSELIEKLKNGEELDLNKEFGLGGGAMAEYRINAMNAKVSSDLRTIATALEIDITSNGKSIHSYVDSSTEIQTHNGILYAGEPDFVELGQRGGDFKSPIGIPYEIRTFTMDIDGQAHVFYQVQGYIIENNKLKENIKGNYIQMNKDMPKTLFDIEI